MWGSTPFDIAKQSKQSAPKVLENVLSSIFQSQRVKVNNFGIQGSTLSGFVSGDDFSQGNVEIKAKNKPDVMYLNYGINDALQNIPLSEYRGGLHRTITACAENRVALILVTPNIIGVNGFGNLQLSSKLKLYADEMKAVAMERRIALVDQFTMTKRDAQVHKPKVVIPDGAHLSDCNYNQLGHNLAIPMVNYAEIKSNDVFKFIAEDIGSSNEITEMNDECELSVNGVGLKSIFLPQALDNVRSIIIESTGKKIYANINGSYQGVSSENGEKHVTVNASNDRAGMKLLGISSSDAFILKSIKVMAL